MRAVVEELERAFRFFDNRFFASTLPEGVVITLEDRPRSSRVGYFCGRRWVDRDLIVITARVLSGARRGCSGPCCTRWSTCATSRSG